MQDPLSTFMTDAWVEEKGLQNGATYQGIVQFLVLGRQNNLELAQVIHKMTGKAAERFKLANRGVIASGNFADIVVFDYNSLQTKPDEPSFTPMGISHVFINGTQVINDGAYTPALAGKMILKDRGDN